MARRRIWEIGCLGMDIVIAASFHPDELTAIDLELTRACRIPNHPEVNVPAEVLFQRSQV